MNNILVTFILLSTTVSLGSAIFDSFHCKAATCHEFYYGFQRFPRQKDYVNVCYETVRSIENISKTYGKCFDEKTRKFNPPCIYSLATAMKKCVDELNDVSEQYARYYCGHRLMQNCAKNIGLEHFLSNSAFSPPTND